MPALIALVCPSTTQLNRPRQDRGTQRFPKQLADHLQQLGVAQGLVQPDQQQWAPDAHHGRIIGIVCISDAKPVQHIAELSTREHRLMMHLHCRRGEGGTCQLLLAEPLATAMMVQPVPQPRSFGRSKAPSWIFRLQEPSLADAVVTSSGHPGCQLRLQDLVHHWQGMYHIRGVASSLFAWVLHPQLFYPLLHDAWHVLVY